VAVAQRISRETRLLLITALLAVATLWVLARIRFPGRPVTADPVTPVLTQIASIPRFTDLAAEVSLTRTRLETSVVAVRVATSLEKESWQESHRPAIVVGEGLAVAWLTAAGTHVSQDDDEVLVFDSASGIGLVRTPTARRPPALWMPRNLEDARYLMVSDVAGAHVSLRPVFVGALVPMNDAVWAADIWLLPEQTAVEPGTFAFTSNGELVGLVVPHGGGRAIVPGHVLMNAAAWVQEVDPAS
jgi:hypothetical protein